MSLRIAGRSPLRAPTRAATWSPKVYPSIVIEFPALAGYFEDEAGPTRIKSGPEWVRIADLRGWANSSSVDDLDEPFRAGVQAFIDALRAAGAKVHVETTRRHKVRAWLMHHAWAVAHGAPRPEDDPHGTLIDWDHGNAKATRAAAQKMVAQFRMKYQAALESNHIAGNAIDMRISWSGTLEIKDKQGNAKTIETTPRTGMNRDLAKVGKTYGVHKLFSKTPDEPHWSANGH